MSSPEERLILHEISEGKGHYIVGFLRVQGFHLINPDFLVIWVPGAGQSFHQNVLDSLGI